MANTADEAKARKLRATVLCHNLMLGHIETNLKAADQIIAAAFADGFAQAREMAVQVSENYSGLYGLDGKNVAARIRAMVQP